MHQLRQLGILLLLCVPAALFAAEQRLVLGVLAARPAVVLEQQYQPLADYLSSQLGPAYRFELRVLDYEQMRHALQRQELDFLLSSPGHFAIVRREFPIGAILATQTTSLRGVRTNLVGGAIIVRADRTDLRTLRDLRQRRIAALPKRTLLGYQAQAYEMVRAGMNLQYLDLRFKNDHDQVVQAVLAREVDAGFVRSGLIEAMAQEGLIGPHDLHVINPQQHPDYPFAASTRLFPEWAFVALVHVDERLMRRVAAALMLFEPQHSAARVAHMAGFSPPLSYHPVEDVARALRLPPFDQAPAFTWSDIWQRHTPILLLYMLGVATLLLWLIWTLRRRHVVQRQRDGLNHLIQAWPQPMLLLQRGQFVKSNQAALALLGLDAERQLLGLRPTDIAAASTANSVSPAPNTALEQQLQTLQPEQVTQFEWELRHASGRSIPVAVTLMRLVHARGEQVLCSWHDLTQHLQDKARLREQAELLAKSNAELEQFAYVASHDLRQPLRMVLSYVQILQRRLYQALDNETRQMMGFITDGAGRMEQMLTSLLEYSRVGRMGEPMAWIDSRAALNDALLFLRPAISESAAEITVAGSWPTVWASRNELTRLLQNLLDNAIKYRAQGQAPAIQASVAEHPKFWCFCIADNGIGIDPNQFQRLFKMFQRLHTRSQYEGSGVGLALARKIVERHGGSIWGESDGLGCGSRFFFTLPKQELPC